MLGILPDAKDGHQQYNAADTPEDHRHGGPAELRKDRLDCDGGHHAAEYVCNLRNADDAAAVLLLRIHIRDNRFPVQQDGRKEEIISAEGERIIENLRGGSGKTLRRG